MGIIKSAMKTGIAVKAFDLIRREMRRPENQQKLKDLMAKAQHEFRKPENQQKAKDVLSKVSKRSKSPGTI